MKIIRFLRGEKIQYGELVDGSVELLDGSIGAGFVSTGISLAVEEVQLLAPCEPTKVIAVGLNYKDHAAELQIPLPQEPVIFLKPPSAVIGPGQKIIYPSQSTRVDYEAELGIVIGKMAKNITVDKANEYILGYTCANDVTARDLQPVNGQWTLAKSFDTFCPLGPVIETGIDANNLGISLWLNGQIRQQSNTCQMIFGVEQLVSYVSSIMTLHPGDVIITGTPSGIGPMQPGDEVTVEIEKIGRLTNVVAGTKVAV
ncbi:fumarylacetoacetate hydrolase family protein [Zhaonella formicivorans]|uniref:fumarylacetoacetate hydrolase family protein n=1 Tax=Zhaonella formicivorans TaxID=2528593 RepID=UPI0010D516BC|nr:fumarylacetoacetate hydrolase family protein [Zhaonella formicivorans]